MCNVISKYIVAALAAALLASCGDKDKDAAAGLLEQARAEFTADNYNSALATLDTLDARYPAQVEIRRQAMHLRPQVIERLTLRELTSADSLIAVLTLSTDSLRDVLEFVPDAFEGYYTSRQIKGKVPAEATGLYARMSTDGVFSVVSSAPKGTQSTSITLTTEGSEATTPDVACDGERNDRSRGVEIITFMPLECDTLGHFASINLGRPITARWNGAKPHTAKLAEPQARALAEVYGASRSFAALRSAQMRKQMLERRLDIARSQMARTFSNDSTAAD